MYIFRNRRHNFRFNTNSCTKLLINEVCQCSPVYEKLNSFINLWGGGDSSTLIFLIFLWQSLSQDFRKWHWCSWWTASTVPEINIVLPSNSFNRCWFAQHTHTKKKNMTLSLLTVRTMYKVRNSPIDLKRCFLLLFCLFVCFVLYFVVVGVLGRGSYVFVCII